MTTYDDVRYPAEVFPSIEPSRLAAVAMLHGLNPPDPTRARVLEIAGGDGVNLVAMAAANPDAHFLTFDLAPTAVARGAALARAAGVNNVRVEVGDVIEWAETLDGPFDYVIVHGLYAWVPEPVRAATMRLIGRVLADNGLAMISYNALPGGLMRSAIRAMLLHHIGDERDPDRRIGLARERLAGFITPRDGDGDPLKGLRAVAEPMLKRPDGSLFHDELGDVYAPQMLRDVVAAGEAVGLMFLADASPTMIGDGLPGADVPEADVVRLAQADDFDVCAFFHRTLFARAGHTPARGIVAENLRGLWATTSLRADQPGHWRSGEMEVTIGDPPLNAALEAMAAAFPWRISLDPLAGSADHAEAIVELVRRELVTLHAAQLLAVPTPGERPLASPLARAEIANGAQAVHALDLRTIILQEPAVRHFLSLLDGTRTRADLARDWQASGFAGQIGVEPALQAVARQALLLS